ncbi:MAG: NADH-quinone oxidoreductase subunit D-related protein [Candidatus Hodarchaeales archaeon]|jgi:Ni,Fe-hydrogenase III large subunit
MGTANKFYWNNKHLINYLSPFFIEVQLKSDFNMYKIENVELETGLNKSGIRKKLNNKKWTTIGEVLGKSCPSCGLFHTVGFYQALESALGLTQDIPLEGKLVRIMFQEWTRISSFLKIITSVIHNSGSIGLLKPQKKIFNHFNKLPQIYSDKKNIALVDLIQLGGIKLRPTFTFKKDLLEWIEKFKSILDENLNSILNSRRLNYLRGLGAVGTNKAKIFSPVGVNARAIGLLYDVRLNDPKNGYEHIIVNSPATIPGKYDILDMFLRYFKEIQTSLDITEQIINKFSLETVSLVIDERNLRNEYSESWTRLETPIGETNYYLKIDSDLNVTDFTWHSATLTNWAFFVQRTIGNPVHYFNLLFDISGFCFYCAEE